MKRINEICRWGTLIMSAVGVTTFVLGAYCGNWYEHQKEMVAMLSLTAGICVSLAILFWAGYMQTTEKHELTYAPALIIAASFGVGFAFMIVKLLTPMAEQMFDATGIASIGTLALGFLMFGVYFIWYACKQAKEKNSWMATQAGGAAVLFTAVAVALCSKENVLNIACAIGSLGFLVSLVASLKICR